MVLKRLLQPSLIQNEKEVNYKLSLLSSDKVRELLSTEYVGGGIFGIEYNQNYHESNTIFFCQPHFKVGWSVSKRNVLIENLTAENDNITYANFYLTKPSIFPISINQSESYLQHLSSIINSNMTLMYQVLLLYRQDNYIEKLQEMHEDYVYNGIETPSYNTFFRKIQRTVNEKIDNLFKWENKHLPIDEVEDKINENGFRINLRLLISGNTERERKKVIEKFKYKLNENSYMNHWEVAISKLNENDVEDVMFRRLNGIGKNQVFSESELIPLLMNEYVTRQEIVEEIKVEDVKIEVESTTNSNSLINLLPKGEKLEQIDSSEYADKFNHALYNLKKINKNLKLIRSQSGATLIQLVFELQKNMRLSDLMNKKVIQDIQTFMGVKGLSIEQGENGNEVSVYVPLKERRNIYIRNILESESFIQFSKEAELPVAIGVDTVGNSIIHDLAKLRSLLVVGTMGSGKSVEISAIILSLLLTKKPSDVSLYLIDPKKVEFPIFSSFSHVSKVVTNVEESIHLLKQLVSEMHRRYDVLKEAEVKNIIQYNKKYPNKKMNYLVLICDEYAELTMNDDNEVVHEYVQSLAQLGRACGVIPIICSQFATVDIIPSKIKNNLATKIAFRLTHSRNFLTILNTKPPFELLGKGDGVISVEGSYTEHFRFQGCLITDGDESALIKKIAKQMKEGKVVYELPEVIEVEEESDIEKLKRCIVQNNTTKISDLQKLMKMNINKLNELMKELCNEEHKFLKAPEYKSQGYRLIADENEISKWKE